MTYTALVMAAKRPGINDPLAVKGNVSHKCLIDMDGRPMIEHVLMSLTGSKHVSRIVISVDAVDIFDHIPMVQEGINSGGIILAQSRDNLFDSVKAALVDAGDFPALICTADNALQTSEMIDHFCEELSDMTCDAAVAITPAETIWAKYPEGQRRPYKLKDGMFSNCNLFAIQSHSALIAAKPFRDGGQFGKSLMRIFKAFGPINLILYRMRLLTLDHVFRRISKGLGITICPVEMPFAEAPIDVDNERTERIALEVLKARRSELLTG